MEPMESMEATKPMEPINDCSICLEKLNKDKKICETPCCLQSFHVVCILIWITEHKTCPYCRADICKTLLFTVKFRTEKQFAEDIAIRQHRFEMLKQIKKINRFNMYGLMPENIGMMVNPLYDVVPDVDNGIDNYNYVNNYDDAYDIDYSDMPELV